VRRSTIKKLLSLVFLLIIVPSVLSSCGAGKEEPDPSSLEPIPSEPVYVGDDLKDSPFVGDFSCTWSSVEHSSTDDPSWAGRISQLHIGEDGSFTLTFDSLAEGRTVMVSVSGKVTVKDDTATCAVNERTSDDFLGNDIESFTLVLLDTDELRYRGEQMGMVGDRDIFTRISS